MGAVLVDLGAVPAPGAPLVLVAQDGDVPPGKGPEFGKASPVGLVVVLLLIVATFLLIRSMSRHIKRVPASFDDPPAGGADAAPERGTEDASGRSAS